MAAAAAVVEAGVGVVDSGVPTSSLHPRIAGNTATESIEMRFMTISSSLRTIVSG